jgi:F-type H+-transporting ATPase subunit delta
VDQLLGRRKVDVEAGSELSEDQTRALIQELEGYLKKKVVLNYKANPDLIGGLYIRSGDLMIDASIKNSLAMYKKTLLDRKILGEGYYEN